MYNYKIIYTLNHYSIDTTAKTALHDHRALFFIAFTITVILLIPFGYLEASFTWLALITAGSLCVVGVAMMLQKKQKPVAVKKVKKSTV